MSKVRSIATLPLDGGALGFHFINTVNAWRGPHIYEYLYSYGELMLWCEKVKILTPAHRKLLLQYADQHIEEAETVLHKLKKVRETLYQLFSAVAAMEDIPDTVLERFNRVLHPALSHIIFFPTPAGIQQGWKEDHKDLMYPVYPVMKSAYDILTQEDRTRIKECETCGWIFLDQTKNNKKRWCSPLTCGTMDKSKRYYHRKKDNAE